IDARFLVIATTRQEEVGYERNDIAELVEGGRVRSPCRQYVERGSALPDDFARSPKRPVRHDGGPASLDQQRDRRGSWAAGALCAGMARSDGGRRIRGAGPGERDIYPAAGAYGHPHPSLRQRECRRLLAIHPPARLGGGRCARLLPQRRRRTL